jgi:hypothetical protein
MHSNPRAFFIIAAVVAGTLVVLGWQRQAGQDLRDELARERTRVAERARQAEKHNLATARAQAEEIAQSLAERAAVAHLQREVDALRRRAKALSEARPVAEAEPAKEPPALTGNVLAFNLWRNVGRTTPEASLETALWASANGDIDTLAHLLVFDADAKNEATSLFAHLPEALRREFVSPERLIAILAAKDVPLGSATILNQYPTPTETKLSVQIFDAEGKHKMALLSLRPDDAGWRFIVPVNAVKRYATWLQSPPSVALAPIVTGANP